jgi:hypothetical protein
MADSTIPNLPAFSGTPNGTEEMETVQSGVSVKIASQKVADLATIVTPITKAALISAAGLNQISVYKLYLITNATAGRLLVKGLTTSTIEDGVLNMTTGQSGTYVLGTDTFTAAGSGNASITPISAAALLALPSFSTTTIYVVTDANSNTFKMAIQAETTSQLGQTGTIVDDVYSGTVDYDLATNTFLNGTIYDGDGNIWNGCLPSATTLGAGSIRNTFGQSISGVVLGTGCFDNTFGAKISGFTFGNSLQYVTVEAGLSGADYSTLPAYSFLYGNAYPSTIFRSGGINYHRYFDVANDRIVITDLATPTTVTYIGGGGGGVASVVAGTNINVDNTDPANPIINSLADRYATTSITSNTVSNGSKTFTVDADLAYIPLQEVLIVNSPSNHMHGSVTSYSGTTLIVDVKTNTGSGTFTSWSINLDGTPVDAITGVGVANRLAYFTAAQVIDDLDTATYPSLTELALVKGVTGSDIQTQINGKLNLTGGSLSGALNEAQGANIASATTTDIGAATGNYVVVTGTTTITALGTVQAGTRRIVNFSGILILTHNGTSLILPTAANITTAAGDTATFISLGSGNWVCVNYMRASGAALVGGGTNTYSVNVISTTLVTVADSTSYHFGINIEIPATTTLRREFKFPQAGTMTAFSFSLLQSTNGSNQTCTLYLRNTSTSTDYTIGTFTSDFNLNGALNTLFSGLSIAVNTTDNWTVKITTPAFTTNPANWIPNGLILIET